MSQAFLFNFVTAEVHCKPTISSKMLTQKNFNLSGYTEVIFEVEIEASPGFFLESVPNLKCEAMFVDTSRLHAVEKTNTGIFDIYGNVETVRTYFFKEASNVVYFDGDLKHCSPTPNAFPCKRIVGFIGFKFNITTSEIISSTKVSFA